MNHYDIIIIGTGAGGSTIARKLATSGKKILVMERGGFIPKEKENWDQQEVFGKGRYRSNVEQMYDKDNNLFAPFTHYCVGGNTKFYGAALLRLRESDFKEVKHFDGISPAWPINYDELEAYYTEAENLYSVHGERGHDVTEPVATADYPFPPLRMEDDMLALFGQLKSLGYHPFPCPVAVRLNENNRAISPLHLSNFDGFPDLTGAKADAQVVSLEGALKNDNVSLMVECYVEKLFTNEDGKKITGVMVKHQGTEKIITGDLVIVACGAINSAALMLRSANEHHPEGLANSSGQVGRNYMQHNNGALIVISNKENKAQFQKAFGLADFYHGSTDSAFPLGAIQLMGKSDYGTLQDLCKDILPGMSVEEISQHSIDFWLTAEDLPDENNRVTLADDGKIKLTLNQRNKEAYHRLKEKMKEIISEIGEKDEAFKNAVFTGYDLGVSGVSHQNGTMRFGIDPQKSVLDINCKAHDLENLYVVDSSFFPSCGAVNPSLTIMANALRVGDHILKNVIKKQKNKKEVMA
jgi:choline dehydrogenase-like flavoprotein